MAVTIRELTWMLSYPTWLKDESVHFMADLGSEAAFQKLKHREGDTLIIPSKEAKPHR